MLKYLRAHGLLIACLASIGTASAQSTQGPSVYEEEDCYISGLIGKMRCYALVRPLSEGETEGGSENITLKGVIVPSDAVVPEADPLVILAGGPGEAASNMAAMLTKLFRKINNSRDLIFFDIRGSGMSNPVACTGNDEDIPPLTDIGRVQTMDDLKTCRLSAGKKVETFTTKTAVADLEALRLALGIEQYNLWGGSYGTRLAQYYIYAHPTHVRSAILDGVVPFTPSYITLQPDHAIKALNKVVVACAEDTACATAFPDFDPIALLDQIGEAREINYNHPVTGRPVTTTTSRTVVAQTIGTALYGTDTRVFIPFALTEAVTNDNWAPLSVLAVDLGRYVGIVTIYAGPFLSTTCAEERDAINKLPETRDPFFRGATSGVMKNLCESWPTVSEPLPAPEEGSLQVPTFMISGSDDPITPPILAEYAALSFSNIRQFTVKNGGHINSTQPCVADFLAEFIKAPHDDSRSPVCIADSHVPAFVVGPTAPSSQRTSK